MLHNSAGEKTGKKTSAISPGFSHIKVSGARDHNLQNITISLPRGSLTVITGLSGSGKSTLAFDTIYAEGQRRYVESLSAYARQFLNMMKKPDVDSIQGLSPAISIEQKTVSRNPRSTVGTVTEIYDYMRLLFARIGIAYSPATGLPITSESVSVMVERLSSFASGSRFYLLAPIVRSRKGEYANELKSLLRQGFQRVKIDGKFYELGSTPALNRKLKHDIDVVVDRISISATISRRLADSLETCLKLSDGIAIAEYHDELNDDGTNKRILFSSRLSCPSSGFSIEEIEPRLFSFNSVKGYCQSCSGLGTKNELDDDLLVTDGRLSLRSGAIVPWSPSSRPSPYYLQTLNCIAQHYNFSLDTPFADLPPPVRKVILYGSNKEKIRFRYKDASSRTYNVLRVFEGIRSNLLRRYRTSDSSLIRERIERFMSRTPCTSCDGRRLCASALAVKIGGSDISQISSLSVQEAFSWFNEISKKLSENQKIIAVQILKEISYRLRFLIDVGLSYLELSRESGTLSGGESQRIRLASQIGSGLTGVLYVLDEPSIGLHQSDNNKLIQTLYRLRDLGNTLIVVEHDEEAIRSADYVIDMGPGAGIHGGKIVASGSVSDILNCKESITGDYLANRRFIPIPTKRRSARDGKYICIKGANQNNLKNIDVSFPLGCLTVVTGVSGSGKSSLVMETLYKALHCYLNRSSTQVTNHSKLEGLNFVDKVIVIDQSPIGRTPRSNPATYIGAFSPIREWFSKLPEAKIRGYQPGRFSFNVKGGRCENCQGAGSIKIEMHFLADVYVDCDICKGKRYNKETLEVLYKNRSISDILDLSVAEGLEFFKSVPTIFSKLSMMHEVGLDYIKIGQSATTLSGGEAQRVKLSKELSKRSIGQTVYILDEPTTGLHFHDVSRLVSVLNRLVNNGHTVIVIEHNLDIIKSADYLIDIGPKGGDEGGELIFAGTPEEITSELVISKSLTGQFLKNCLAKKQKSKKEVL